jgi:hypothetical protein
MPAAFMIAWFIPQGSALQFGSLNYAADDIINSGPAFPENHSLTGHPVDIPKIDENDRSRTFHLLTLDDYFPEHFNLRRVFVWGVCAYAAGGNATN